MKRLIQGFIAGVAVTSAITGIALSRKSAVTAIKSRVKKAEEGLKEKTKRTINVEGDTDGEQTSKASSTVTPEYSQPETAETGAGSTYKRRSEAGGYRKPSQS